MNTMKKCFALLLALLMMLAVSGCAESLQQIEIPPLPQITPTPAPDFSTPSAAPDNAGGESDTLSYTQPGSELGGESDLPGSSDAAETPAPDVQQPIQAGDPIVIIPSSTVVTQTREESSPISVSISRTELSENDPNEGTEKILSFTYDVVRLRAEENAAAAEKINELLATIEDAFYTGNANGLSISFLGFNQMLEAAEDNYTYVTTYQTDGPLELSDSLTAQVTRLDDKVFSILYSEASYSGGAHGSYWQIGFSFDMSTGELLTLEDLGGKPDELAEHLVQSMLNLAREDRDGYYSQSIVEEFLPAGGREEAFRGLLREGAWYFDREGLVFSSMLYELGPYAAGITVFHIPYADLEGQIKEEYLFPSDRAGSGTLSVSELSQVSGGSLPIVDSVQVNPDGQQLALVAEGQIYDVRISRVYYVDRFYEDAQLWAASTLKDCAIQLQTVVPEGMPDLLISYYTADGQRFGKLLSQSGVDGSFLLVDDDIHAVG